MSSLLPNLVNRIERLPKPTNVTGALLPLFEAIMNSIHSTQEKFGTDVANKGRVCVTIATDRNKENVSASIEDNGLGLNDKNWKAFVTTDTDHKMSTGGKGVGRLLWLDCFKSIKVSSTFTSKEIKETRTFEFVLANENQIQNEKISETSQNSETNFFVKFDGLRNNGYQEKFPGRGNYIYQHLTSHFLPTFIGSQCPEIQVIIGDETKVFPEAISEIVRRKSDEIKLDDPTFEKLNLILMECDKVASADLNGTHFIHFIAHNRTVHSQAIDSKLGLKFFGDPANQVFHGLVSGRYLNENVNQERTAFTFEDAVLDKIINEVCMKHIGEFLDGPLSKLKAEQAEKITRITSSYPSVAFGEIVELQKKVPAGELKDDAIYSHLARERYRRDEKQAEKIRGVLTRLKDSNVDASTFGSAINEASKAIEDAEQKSLAEYVLRRKVVLDFLSILLEKVQDNSRSSSYQREDILHSFICPLRVNTLSEHKQVEIASHDLWILDERLTFAQYFSSDTEFSKLAELTNNNERPDILIFDHVHGLRQTDQQSKVLLVELKRPGRKDYDDGENPQLQIERYIRELKSGKMQDVKGRPIQLGEETIFHCFIVADIVGKLVDWTYSWQHTADGRGRIYRANNGFRGTIELVGWDALLSDAKARNQAFFDRVGISGKSFFSPD